MNQEYPIVLIEEEIVKFPEGDVFPANTKQYIVDGDRGYRISGFSPVIIDEKKGEVFDPYENEYLEPEALIRMFREKISSQK